MEIAVEGTVERIRGGFLARARRIFLAGHGQSYDDAAESLRHLVFIWCQSLAGVGELENALKNRGITWHDGEDTIKIKLSIEGQAYPAAHS